MREKPRVVLDTNLFVSALLSPTSTPNRLLHLWEQRQIVLLASVELIHEVDRVLQRAAIKERYGISEEQINRLLFRLEFIAERTIPLTSLPLHSRDPKDDDLLALALGGNAEYLITGDNDLLVLNGNPALANVQIITVAAFLEQQEL